MTTYHTAFFAFSCIVLFLYGLKGFGKEVQEVGGTRLRDWLTRLTNNRLKGLMLGAFLTAVIQSSSAVSAMTVALVDAGAFSFGNSLAVLLGAGIGTTSTAWLVSLNFTAAGVYFIVFGAIIGALPYRLALVGKSLFYFGFILFTLELLSTALGPIRESPKVMEWLSGADSIMLALVVGVVVTAIVQSSSVVSGLVVVLAQGGFLELNDGIGIIIGAKVGSTSTALLASLKMNEGAKLAALSNFIFYFIGAMVFLPFAGQLAQLVRIITPDPGFQVAFALLIFSTVIALGFLPFLKPFSRLLLRWKPLAQAAPNGTLASAGHADQGQVKNGN